MTTLQDRPTAASVPPVGSHRRLIIGGAVVAVLALVVTWLIGFSPVFGVRTVDVRGNSLVSDATITKAAAIDHGTPLVRLDTGAVRHRVLQLPDIAAVSVQESFPSTVVITVQERAAVGYVVDGSTDRLVDRTGDAYRTAPSRPAGLPKLVVPAGASASTLAGVADVAAHLSPGLQRRIASIAAMDAQAITLVLHDGRVVAWGTSAQSAEKARILPVLLRQPGQQYDLTNPLQPVVRP
ncbi:MAG: cell division protein FtsQ/DivIB [Jatrophihabitans sp.]|uniref:cell division protein FtsQ/DivIB n=1 Tax=Jatrophihabitans sp. TaxID=1932789 RepID=UPI003F813160